MHPCSRSVDDIAARMKHPDSEDFLGTYRSDLLSYLPFEQAKEHLKEGTSAKQWADATATSKDGPVAETRDYMAFAWGAV